MLSGLRYTSSQRDALGTPASAAFGSSKESSNGMELCNAIALLGVGDQLSLDDDRLHAAVPLCITQPASQKLWRRWTALVEAQCRSDESAW